VYGYIKKYHCVASRITEDEIFLSSILVAYGQSNLFFLRNHTTEVRYIYLSSGCFTFREAGKSPSSRRVC